MVPKGPKTRTKRFEVKPDRPPRNVRLIVRLKVLKVVRKEPAGTFVPPSVDSRIRVTTVQQTSRSIKATIARLQPVRATTWIVKPPNFSVMQWLMTKTITVQTILGLRPSKNLPNRLSAAMSRAIRPRILVRMIRVVRRVALVAPLVTPTAVFLLCARPHHIWACGQRSAVGD